MAYRNRTLAAVLLLALVGGAFLAGYGYGQGRPVSGGDADTQGFALLREVLHQIRQTYLLRSVDTNRLFYGAARGMVEALRDPYSRFLDPAAFKEIKEDFSGVFEGVGIFVELKDGRPVVVQPIPGTPAFKAGLRPGDRILAVDGASTAGMSLEEVVARIRGRAGTTVRLQIARRGRSFIAPLVRTRIANVSVWGPEVLEAREQAQLRRARIAYVRLLSFRETTPEEFDRSLRVDQGARGLLLDMRNNSGGLLDVSIEVAGRFIPAGQPVVHIVDRDGRRQTMRASRGTRVAIPVVIMVNEFTASAAEIVSGALQDHHVATLVGLQTFGKGVIQSIITLPGGSGATITSGKYLTPSGRDINKRGIVPNVRAGAKLEGLTEAEAERVERAQMARAVQVLEQRIARR